MKRVITTEKIPIKLWLDEVDAGTLIQAKNLANLPFALNWIAIMPDAHLGYGMPIGGVMATDGVVVPNAVGVDIGCGMAASRLSLTEIDKESIEKIIGQVKNRIPVGFEHNLTAQEWEGFDEAPDIPVIQRNLGSARKQLGTLGGGNHFIEIQTGSDGHIWLMVHSGSRNYGLKTANEYHKKAQQLCQRWHSDIPDRDLSFLPIESDEGGEYYAAMNFCLKFAQANRVLMMKKLLDVTASVTGASVEHEINIHHNYAAFEKHFGRNVLVHRKGATKAATDIEGIIPGSMGTCSYIVKGLGNRESFMSCSHGAGRIMGRKQAIRELDLTKEQKKMKNIVHDLYSKDKLEEAPGAYKDINEVMNNQKDLVEITVKLTPLGVVKG
ncbi:MAG: RtcB family protein [Deltaproteobacteria bacterium]|nr:RtcB family protein [Deltaproteobacteria bacterium]MCK5679344.1 RtcB family protein [bacterium]